MAVKNFVNLFGTRYDLADGANLAYSVEASSTAAAAHAVGSKFLYNGYLYETINTISVGGTISVGTNCRRIYVGDELTAADKRLEWIQKQLEVETVNPYAWEQGTLDSTAGTAGNHNTRNITYILKDT